MVIEFAKGRRVIIDQLKFHAPILGYGNHRLGIHEGCGGLVQVVFDSSALQNRAFCGDMESCGFDEVLFMPELDTPAKLEAEYPADAE